MQRIQLNPPRRSQDPSRSSHVSANESKPSSVPAAPRGSGADDTGPLAHAGPTPNTAAHSGPQPSTNGADEALRRASARRSPAAQLRSAPFEDRNACAAGADSECLQWVRLWLQARIATVSMQATAACAI